MFSIYGLLIAGSVAMSQWRGWSLDKVNEVRDVPRSIRDNPGAWRPHYSGGWGFGSWGSGGSGGRYSGGK